MHTPRVSNSTPLAFALVIALLIASLVSGCSGSNNSNSTQNPTDPKFTDQPAPPEASPSPTEYIPASANGPAQNVPTPEYPDEAREETVDGAEAFMKFWWTTVDYLMLTGDPSPMYDHSIDICKQCEITGSGLESLYERGSWVVSKPIITSDFLVDLLEGNITMVIYDLEQLPLEVHQLDGTLDENRSLEIAERGPWEAALEFDADANTWLMIETAEYKER